MLHKYTSVNYSYYERPTEVTTIVSEFKTLSLNLYKETERKQVKILS